MSIYCAEHGREECAEACTRKGNGRCHRPVGVAGWACYQHGGPPEVGERTVVAKTCVSCGLLRPGRSFHQIARGRRRVADCATCLSRKERQRESFKRYQTNPASRARSRQQAIEDNRRSRGSAARHNNLWTGPELELLFREGLSLKELATQLGRTIGAVSTKRSAARNDPKYIQFVGVPR